MQKILGLLLILVIASFTAAQEDISFPPYVAVVNSTQVVYVDGDVVTPVDLGVTEITRVLSFTWSDDGHYLAVSFISDGYYQLVVTDFERIIPISESLSTIPPMFDGDVLLYVQITEDFSSFEVYQKPMDSEAVYLGTLDYEACGGGQSTPMHLAYYREIDTGGIFERALPGMVYQTSSCPNTAGASVFSLTMGSSIEIPSVGFSPRAISPDGLFVVGVNTTGELQILDLESQEFSTLETSLPVDQVTWVEEGLYFSTWTEIDSDFGLTEEELAQLDTEWQVVPSSAHQSAIYQIQPDGSGETLLLEDYAWAIARLNIIDGQLFYSSIENADGFLRLVLEDGIEPAFEAGVSTELNCFSLDPDLACPEAVTASMYAFRPRA